MIGRRIPWVPGSDPLTLVEQPGDYVGPIEGYTGPVPSVFFLLPVERMDKFEAFHHVSSPPHVFRECADGSLEIRESIGAYGRRQWKQGDGYVWHGYLDEGNIWRVC